MTAATKRIAPRAAQFLLKSRFHRIQEVQLPAAGQQNHLHRLYLQILRDSRQKQFMHDGKSL